MLCHKGLLCAPLYVRGSPLCIQVISLLVLSKRLVLWHMNVCYWEQTATSEGQRRFCLFFTRIMLVLGIFRKHNIKSWYDLSQSIHTLCGTILTVQEECKKLKNKAAWSVTQNGNYETGNMTGISEESDWVTLEKWKHDSGHTLLYTVLQGKAATLTNDLLPKDRERTEIISF